MNSSDTNLLFCRFRRIYWEEGFHAFYTGFSPAMCGVMVYAGTSFFTYESLKFYLSEYQKSQVPAAILSYRAIRLMVHRIMIQSAYWFNFLVDKIAERIALYS